MVANWKMNKTRDDALAFIYAINENLPSCDKVDTVICAPSILLRDLVKRQGDNLKIGAQNMYYAEFGAFTGEVSPVMLQTTGVEYVIVGHSERRSLFGETDDMINKKVKAAIEHNLIPILCVGETLEQRELGITSSVIRKQLENALEGIPSKDINNVVIAYEPIWAIGTGKTASSNDAEVECKNIREAIKELYNALAADEIRILYGGSMKPSNAKELLKMPNIDGGLVGGASLDPNSFLELVKDCL